MYPVRAIRQSTPSTVAERKMIVADRLERHGREALQDAQRLRPLDRELRIALARIFNLRARAIVRANMLEVLILIARVDAQKIVRVGNLVHEQIVDKSALLGHQSGVLRLPDHQL